MVDSMFVKVSTPEVARLYCRKCRKFQEHKMDIPSSVHTFSSSIVLIAFKCPICGNINYPDKYAQK
jgi:RNase P subunit RPR2